MAASFDELIAFLLDEIALRGEQGKPFPLRLGLFPGGGGISLNR